MHFRHSAFAVFRDRPWPFLKLAAEVIIFALLFTSVQALSIASSDVENENQIHDFHKRLSRYNHSGEDLRVLAAKAPDKRVHAVSAPPAVGTMSSSDPD